MDSYRSPEHHLFRTLRVRYRSPQGERTSLLRVDDGDTGADLVGYEFDNKGVLDLSRKVVIPAELIIEARERDADLSPHPSE